MLACNRVVSCAPRSARVRNALLPRSGCARPFSCVARCSTSILPLAPALNGITTRKAGPSLSVRRSARTAKVLASAETSMAKKLVLIPIANGTEEMEAVITIDVLRRAGAEVTVSSVEDTKMVICSRGVVLVADSLIDDCLGKTFDLIACPGGMPGAQRLSDSSALTQLVSEQREGGRLYAAICATPAVFFEAKGLIGGKNATSHPAFSDKLVNQSQVTSRVVTDGTLTTSRGPGTAFEFALSLVKQLYGEAKEKEVAGPMVMYDYKV